LSDRALQEAKARLTIWDVWEAAGLGPCEPARMWRRDDCVVRSPLRANNRESFSIGKEAKVFNDFRDSEIRGGVWEFAALAFGLEEGKDIRTKLVEIAGTGDLDESQGSGGEPLSKTAWRAQQRERERAAAERIAANAARDNALPMRPDDMDLRPWPEHVRARWMEGMRAWDIQPGWVERLAKWRGWPVKWVSALRAMGQLSVPLYPGVDPASGYQPRGYAFRVLAPMGEGPEGLQTIGYHQYIPWMDQRKRQTVRCWCYCPNDKGGDRSEYMRTMRAEGRRIWPLPFAIGVYDEPERVVILEGQWDALTYYGMLGGFDSCDYGPSALVLGLRGASSYRYVLMFWRRQLEGRKVIIIPDNDKAGSKIVRRDQDRELAPTRLSFADVCEQICDVSVRELPDIEGVKDFNDFWNHKRRAGEW